MDSPFFTLEVWLDFDKLTKLLLMPGFAALEITGSIDQVSQWNLRRITRKTLSRNR